MFRCSAILLLLFAAPAQAMNWEGKEDWLDELPQALIYGDELPRPPPVKLKPCTAAKDMNPYEQVQIPGKNCDPTAAPPSSER